jgi:hypothetical protein
LEIKYADWETAKLHMEAKNKCKYNNKEYFIIDNDLCNSYLGKPMITSLTLKMLDSKEWILLLN